MASSETEICNQALSQIGAKKIGALTDNSREARLCADFYPKSLQEVTRMAPFPCTMKEIELAQDTITVNVFGFTYSYQLPVDYIRIWYTSLDIQWGGSDDEWQIRGRKLVTDATKIQVGYGFRVIDTLLFDSLFEKALTLDLATKLAWPVSKISNMQATFDQMRDRAAKSAMAAFSQEQRKKRFRSTTLTKDVR